MSVPDDRKCYCSRCLTTFAEDVEQCPNLACRRKRPGRGWGTIFAEGDLFDRTYRIHKMLAVGGAGVTYVGRELDGSDEEVGPRIAIKVLLAARDQGPYVRRLATEAQIIQELDHPNIVQYLGFVHRAGHSPYLLTRFESGGSLLDHMRRVGTLSVKQAAMVGRQICWALEKAHERDIVHRDLKPENVLLTREVGADEDPVVRVADFGIAKVQGSLGTNLTRVGAFVGTPHYAAPEQFVGGAVTEAADVYALGALLYFTMTARHVVRFADRVDPEDGFQLLCDSLPPTLERPSDDPDAVRRMQAILAAAMQVDPAARCTVVELDELLQALAAGQEPDLPLRAGGSSPEASGSSGLGSSAPVGLADRAAHLRTGDAEKAPSSTAGKEPGPQHNLSRPVATEPPTQEDVVAPAAPLLPESPSDDADEGGRAWGPLFALVVLMGVGGVVLAGAGVVGLLMGLQPDLFESSTADGSDEGEAAPVDLAGLPTLMPDTETHEQDLHQLRKSLEAQGRAMKKACGASAGQKAEVTLAVDGGGVVLGGAAEDDLGRCVVSSLQGQTVERLEDRSVKVSYVFVW